MKWIPFSENEEVQDQAEDLGLYRIGFGTLILFAIGIASSKWFESGLSIVAEQHPVILFGVDFSLFFWWGVVVVLGTVIYLYYKFVYDVADETYDAAEEKTDEIKEEISNEKE